MGKGTDYVSHQPDEQGFVQYSEAEHETWSILMDRQSLRSDRVLSW